MKKIVVRGFFLLFIFCWLSSSAIGSVTKEGNREEILNKVSTVQIPFIENKGQIKDKRVKYYAKTFAGTTFITSDGQIVHCLLNGSKEGEKKEPNSRQDKGKEKDRGEKAAKEDARGWTIRERPVSASISKVSGEEEAVAKVSYFLGKTPADWTRNISTCNLISLGEVYEGIELKLKAYGNNIEKLFFVKPKTNPGEIKMKLEGAKGLRVNKDGELEAETGSGEVKFTKPVAYQVDKGERKPIEVAYTIEGDEYGFRVGEYDHSKELVIDPLLAATYLGGFYSEYAYSITLDQSGNVYVTGKTNSDNFPATPGAFDPVFDRGDFYQRDVFISKFDSNLHYLLASTFLGGRGSDEAYSIVLDKSGNVYVTGDTESDSFPTTSGAYDTTFNGHGVFISKLDSNLHNLLASTFLGGGYGKSIALDQFGNVYVAGITSYSNFPTTSDAFDTSFNRYDDGFIAKLDNNLHNLLASTFLGGGYDDRVHAMALDQSGNVYVTGVTGGGFPTTYGAYDSYHNGNGDAFISKLDSNLHSLLVSTYLGGGGNCCQCGLDRAYAIALDQSGNVYVAGHTDSFDFPTTSGAYDRSYNGDHIDSNDAFISKFDSNLHSLLASTFFGGDFDDEIYSIALDQSGNIYGGDGFTLKFDNNLKNLLASITTGNAYSITLDQSGNVYVGSGVGVVPSGAYNTTPNDICISKFDSNLTLGDPCAGVNCDDGDFCTLDTCSGGTCYNDPIPGCCYSDDSECDDGNLCTTDRCSAGRCSNIQMNCDDSDPCTYDYCSEGVCHNDQIPNCSCAMLYCDDGDSCTFDHCSGVECYHDRIPGCGEDPCWWGSCDDGDPCTDESCFEGRCQYFLSSPEPECENAPCAMTMCDDGDPCTFDHCFGGMCYSERMFECIGNDDPCWWMSCDDGDPCTDESCSWGMCSYMNIPGCCHHDIDCDDGDPFTIDSCSDRTCSHLVVIELSADKDCNRKDSFNTGSSPVEDIYVSDTLPVPSGTYTFYLVKDRESWVEGDPLCSPTCVTSASIPINSSGSFCGFLWTPPAGDNQNYDIILDGNGNGYYDTGIDFIDSTLSVGAATLIELSSFTATSKLEKIVLEWETASELDNVGFNLWRSTAEEGEYIKINSRIIEAEGGATLRAEYSYSDSTAKPGIKYYYKLEDIDTRGNSTFHGLGSAMVPAASQATKPAQNHFPLPPCLSWDSESSWPLLSGDQIFFGTRFYSTQSSVFSGYFSNSPFWR